MRNRSHWKQQIVTYLGILMLLVSCNYPPYLQQNLQTNELSDLSLQGKINFAPADVFVPYIKSLGTDANLFGIPISAAYTDPATGDTIQYFQKVRLEAEKMRGGDDSIKISSLGEWMLNQAVGTEVIIDQDCIEVPDSEYLICADFREFYEAHNGSALFGKPISNVYQTEDRFYQYFEKTCLIWDPGASEPYQVNLATLGELYLLRQEPYREYITQANTIEAWTHISQPEQKLQVYIAFTDPFIARDQTQTVYIQVTDEQGQPMEKAMIGVLVNFPDGTQQQYRPACTDAQGMTSFAMLTFSNRELLVNDIITVDVTASTDQAEGFSSNWFRIWE